MELNELEKSLGHSFKNQNHLIRALTRKDAVEKNQVEHELGDQNIYATLGDAILTAIVVTQLFDSGRDTPGIITDDKNDIVNKEALASISQELNIGNYMLMSNNEKDNEANTKPRPLAETLEAIIGAIYLDSDFETSMNKVTKWKGFERLTEQHNDE